MQEGAQDYVVKGERDGAAARAELERSFVRMGVDHIDMIQLHNLVEEDEWRQAFSPARCIRTGTVRASFSRCAMKGRAASSALVAA